MDKIEEVTLLKTILKILVKQSLKLTKFFMTEFLVKDKVIRRNHFSRKKKHG